MRFLSAFRTLPERALAALYRFPIVILAGAFLAGVIIVEPDGGVGERWLMVALLAVIVAFDATLLKERLGQRGPSAQLGVAVASGGVLALLYWSIDLVANAGNVTPPYDLMVGRDEPLRVAAFGVALHALAAVIPFVGRERLGGFWDYNRRLFHRALASGLFSGVLYGGLAIALLAIDELLSIDVGENTYLHLFAVMAGIVNTWFFISGVPTTDVESTTVTSALAAGGAPPATQNAVDDAHYPRGLKVFVQFVLLPLAAVYLVILYLYVGRIILEWELPDGQVSYLIFGYAAIGTLAYLLIYPLRDDADNRWIRGFARGFFMALAPLLVVLVIALLRRTSDYGLTEPRYYGVVLAGWLALIVAYFLTRREDIRIIPTTLAVGAVLASIGPWSATPVAIRSQIAELGAIAARDSLGETAASSVRDIAHFLYERSALEDAAEGRTARPDTVDTAEELAALHGVEPGWLASTSRGFYLGFGDWRHVDVQGFDDAIVLSGSLASTEYASLAHERITITLRVPGTILVATPGDSVELRLDSAIAAGRRASDSVASAASTRLVDPAPALDVAAASAQGLRARVVLTSVNGTWGADSTMRISDVNGVLLVGSDSTR